MGSLHSPDSRRCSNRHGLKEVDGIILAWQGDLIIEDEDFTQYELFEYTRMPFGLWSQGGGTSITGSSIGNDAHISRWRASADFQVFDRFREHGHQLSISLSHQMLRIFLGLTNYYRRFIPKYSDVADPLQIATKRHNVRMWVWTAICLYIFSLSQLLLQSWSFHFQNIHLS